MTIFCDLDGTLIDSSARHIFLLEMILSKYPNIFDISDFGNYLLFKANGGSTKTYLIKCGIPESTARQISKQWIQHIEDDALLLMDVIYPDALTFLQNRSAVQNKIVFVSARNNQNGLKSTLRRLDLLQYADKIHIVSQGNVAEKKAYAIRSMATQKDIVVGDTETDWNCAKILGIQGFVLNRGFRSKSFWERLQIPSYENLDEIEKRIEARNSNS